jgi:hypothetical protein
MPRAMSERSWMSARRRSSDELSGLRAKNDDRCLDTSRLR